MAIGLWMQMKGGTQEMYDAVDAKLGVAEDPPEGLIFHSAGPTEDGWSIIDFWESREHFDRFSESRLGPAIVSAGTDGPGDPPQIKEFPVYNVIKP